MDNLQLLKDRLRYRKCIGSISAIIAFIVVGAVVCKAYKWINDDSIMNWCGPDFELKYRLYCHIATLIARGCLSIACVYFAYAMIRLAERMLIPEDLMRGEDSVGTIKALLGLDDKRESTFIPPFRKVLDEVTNGKL